MLAYAAQVFLFLAYGVIFLLGKRTPLKKRPSDDCVRKILVVRLDHIGDVLITGPVFEALKKKYPRARLTVLAGSWSRDLLEQHPFVDEVLTYDAPWWKTARGQVRKGVWGSGLRDICSLIKQMREKRFDLVLEPRGDVRQFLLFGYAIGAPYVFSFDRTGSSFLLSEAVPYEEGLHEMLKNEKLLAPLGINTVSKECQVYPGPGDRAYADKVVDEIRSRGGSRFAVFVPGARKPLKCWPLENFISLARWLLERDPAISVVWLGGSMEEGLSKRLSASFSSDDRSIDLIGKCSLLKSYALLSKSAFIVTHDGPVSHMASSLTVPTVVLFGPTEAARFRPWGDHIQAVQRDYPCCPCLLEDCAVTKSRFHAACMGSISLEDIQRSIEAFDATKK